MVEPKESNNKIETGLESGAEKPTSFGQKIEQTRRPEQQERLREQPGALNSQEGATGNEQKLASPVVTHGIGVSNQLLEREKKVEKILEEGLEQIYANLPPEKKVEFRRTGEATAHQINLMLSGAKVKIKKLVSLIRDWLKIIPGINFFFLEQEAKIKADEIIKLKEQDSV